MKFTVHTKELSKALNRLSAVPGSRGPSAVTLQADEPGGLFLQRDTNLVSMRVECPAEIEHGGSTAVDFHALHQRVARTPSEKLEIANAGKVGSDKLEIKTGTATASLVIWPQAHLGHVILKPEAMPVTFAAEQLAAWLKMASVASGNNARPHLNGVCIRSCLGRIIVLGTDGRRIHCALGDDAFEEVHRQVLDGGDMASFDGGVLIPLELVSTVERLLGDNGGDASLIVGESTAQVSAPVGWVRFTVPVDLPPDLETILKETHYSMEMQVDRVALLEAVIAAAPSGLGDAQAIHLRSVMDKLMVEASDGNGNEYKDFVPAEIKSRDHFSIKVAAGFMIDFLKHLTGDEITLGYLADYHSLACRQPDRYLSLALMRETK